MPSNKFWKFKNLSDDEVELFLYGDIADSTWWGDEVTPKQFADDLAEISETANITVRINSGGGDVFAAHTIGNLLSKHKGNVIAVIDGLCASAATIVACHCNKVMAAEDSSYMIHPVRVGICSYVDETDIDGLKSALVTCKENILNLYVKKTGKDKEYIEDMMNKTTWFTGPEAKEEGFIDEITEVIDPNVVENRSGLLFINSISMNMPYDKAPNFMHKPKNRISKNGLVNIIKNPKKEESNNMEVRTVDELREYYPELVREIEDSARADAMNTERQRIKEIEEMCIAGCEDFANKAKFEEPMSAEAFARQTLKNFRNQGMAFLDASKNDAEKSGVNNIGASNDPGLDPVDEEDSFIDSVKKVVGKK
ncbi:MAG: Clp protease ClpP [Eubacteriales bacterium]|nr:Clp protease ClpP [Eubacteriales bacterium]